MKITVDELKALLRANSQLARFDDPDTGYITVGYVIEKLDQLDASTMCSSITTDDLLVWIQNNSFPLKHGLNEADWQIAVLSTTNILRYVEKLKFLKIEHIESKAERKLADYKKWFKERIKNSRFAAGDRYVVGVNYAYWKSLRKLISLELNDPSREFTCLNCGSDNMFEEHIFCSQGCTDDFERENNLNAQENGNG